MKLSIPFDYAADIFKADESDGTWIVEGFVAVSEIIDRQDDILTMDAIQASSKDLVGMTMLLNHDASRPIGRILQSATRGQGLYVKAQISKTEPDVWAKVNDGTLSKFSIRGRIIEAYVKFVEDLHREVNFIEKMELVEASLVSVPANPKAEVVRFYVEKAFREFLKSGGVITHRNGGDSMTLEQQVKALTDMLAKAETDEAKKLFEVLIKDLKEKQAGNSVPSDDEKRRRMMEEKEKQVEELKVSVAKAQEQGKAIEDQLKKAEAERDALKHSGEQAITSLQEQLKKLTDELSEQKATAETNQRWESLVGKSYRQEDADAIKPILKKQVSGQPLSKEELDTLIQKKVVGSSLVVGQTRTEGVGDLDDQKAADTIRDMGIRVRTDSKFHVAKK